MRRLLRGGWRSAALLMACLTTAAGCNVMLTAEERETWTRTYSLAQGGSFEIHNTNGRIQVDAYDGNAIEVSAQRVVRAATHEGARDALRRTEISETVSPNRVVLDSSKGGLGLQINVSRRVDYVVRVPRWAEVRLRSTNGDIEVSGLTGAFESSTTNGRIRATALEGGAEVSTTNGTITLDFAKVHNDIRCETTNGTVDVTVPKGTNAQLAASVTNGAINVSGLDLTSSQKSRRRLDASIGDGGPSIRIETTNGSIHVRGK
jgi:putative adhesin